jgi:hypothetical protein
LDSGTLHYFDFISHHRLALNIFLFPISTAKLIGEFYSITIGEAQQISVSASSILLYLLCCANATGAAIRTPPIGDKIIPSAMVSGPPLSVKTSFDPPSMDTTFERIKVKHKKMNSYV